MPPSKSATATVLLVDDNEILRAALAKLLMAKDYRMLEAPDAQSALSSVMQLGNQLDVLIIDIVLPGMNGFELARAVRSLYPKIGIIYMSAYCSPETVDSELNSDVLLAKPVTISVLVEALERVLRRDRGKSSGGH
jgi:CheY-like chemotaxis protein